jgi:hypothetical protein
LKWQRRAWQIELEHVACDDWLAVAVGGGVIRRGVKLGEARIDHRLRSGHDRTENERSGAEHEAKRTRLWHWRQA